jgi:hypothetical protein
MQSTYASVAYETASKTQTRLVLQEPRAYAVRGVDNHSSAEQTAPQEPHQ